jgi:hypothetical protein
MSADQPKQNQTTLTERLRHEMLVPRDWLAAIVRLLDVMAGEGVGMESCEDPADLVITLADHFGVGDFDDCLQAVLEKIANHE